MMRFATLWCAGTLCAAVLGAQGRVPAPLGAALHARASVRAVAVSPGSATLLVTLAVDDGWHVSWRVPGETGLPTRLSWSLPAGVRVQRETWPVPVLTRTDVGVTHTLEGDVPWLVDFAIDSATVAGRLVTVTLRYGICRDICIPERQTVQGELPGRATAVSPVPAPLQARLVRAGDPIPARRLSPTSLCVVPTAALRATPLPDVIADSGSGIDALPAIRAERRGRSHVFFMNTPKGAALRTGDRLLFVRGATGVMVPLDFRRPAPGCTPP